MNDRIATALERIADALERIPAITVGEFDLAACDDRTCTDRDHWAPTGRINHGSTPTTCVHGQDHSDALECEYRCAATMPGHWCTRREHADDRHVWAMSGEEAQRILREEDWFADPLDESDHRPRHDQDGAHVYRHGPGHWHYYGLEDGPCNTEVSGDDPVTLAHYNDHSGPLAFCDCPDDAIIEAENGATD